MRHYEEDVDSLHIGVLLEYLYAITVVIPFFRRYSVLLFRSTNAFKLVPPQKCARKLLLLCSLQPHTLLMPFCIN